MNEDIVTRLRRVPEEVPKGGMTVGPNIFYQRCQDAADEIERLRQEVQNLSDISDGWWQFHIGKISPEEMGALLQKADATAKRPIPGYYDADKRQNEEARRG